MLHCCSLHTCSDNTPFHTRAQIPTFGFLYVAGYIGHVGRQYIIKVKEDSKPTDKEIILDVPLALKLAFQGWAWPLAAVQVCCVAVKE